MNNTIYYNKFGIEMTDSDNCTIKNNRFKSNLHGGIYLSRSNYNIIQNNTINTSYYGIQILHSNNISIYFNHIELCTYYGVVLQNATFYCCVYDNNFINNSQFHPTHAQAYDDGISNIFYNFDNLS